MMLFFILSLIVHFNVTHSDTSSCEFHNLSPPIHAILCAVENEVWKIPTDSVKFKNMHCLIGKDRCKTPLAVPTEEDVPPSPPPPSARNPQYQELAMIAEKVVPKTWWRDGFASDRLMLSKTNDELPTKLYDGTSNFSNKRLKNLYQCVTRQQFMRKSYNFEKNPYDISTAAVAAPPVSSKDAPATACSAMSHNVIQEFLTLWKEYQENLDGSIVHDQWFPRSTDNGKFLMAANEVLEYFYMNHGGVWTGCFAFEKFPDCRGALAGK
jgi:hypothetical protein